MISAATGKVGTPATGVCGLLLQFRTDDAELEWNAQSFCFSSTMDDRMTLVVWVFTRSGPFLGIYDEAFENFMQAELNMYFDLSGDRIIFK